MRAPGRRGSEPNRTSGGRAGRIVVIGGSAGAHGALRTICGALPLDFPAPILVAVHLAAHLPSRLADILTRTGPFVATDTCHGERPVPGRIYVAPADHHLRVATDGSAELSHGPPENGFRPSIDTLFRSVASAFGPSAVAVVLSGSLTDGAAGADAIRHGGGTVIVQDPDDARFDILPRAALKARTTDMVLRAADIPAALQRLACS